VRVAPRPGEPHLQELAGHVSAHEVVVRQVCLEQVGDLLTGRAGLLGSGEAPVRKDLGLVRLDLEHALFSSADPVELRMRTQIEVRVVERVIEGLHRRILRRDALEARADTAARSGADRYASTAIAASDAAAAAKLITRNPLEDPAHTANRLRARPVPQTAKSAAALRARRGSSSSKASAMTSAETPAETVAAARSRAAVATGDSCAQRVPAAALSRTPRAADAAPAASAPPRMRPHRRGCSCSVAARTASSKVWLPPLGVPTSASRSRSFSTVVLRRLPIR